MKHGHAIAKRLPLLLGSLLLGLHLGRGSLAAVKSADLGKDAGVECFLVENASVAAPTPQEEARFGRANAGHQIANGPGKVLAFRAYEGLYTDSLQFLKVTLEFSQLPSLAMGDIKEVPVKRSYFSSGSGVWFDGLYDSADNPFTHFYILRTPKGIEARISKTFYAIYNDGAVRKVTVDRTCPVVLRTVGQLSPWEGRVGTTRESFYP
jgi:hypothetical protein